MRKYPKIVPVWVDDKMARLVAQAATQRMTSVASYGRQAIAAALIRDGYVKPENFRRETLV
jgi:hypothetical protein